MNPQPFLDLATRAALTAGELLLEHYRRPATGVGSKSTPTDPVSDADRASDTLLLEMISAERPDDGFITEESEGRRSSSGINWVLDPLDATVNFLYRIPWWCVSIAVEDSSEAVAAAIYNPIVDEMFTATRGGGAFLNGDRITVRNGDDLSQSLVGTGFYYDSETRAQQSEIVGRVLPAARDVRRMGSAALDLASVACGRLDAYYEAPNEHWDVAAGVLVVEEAGGLVSTFPGPAGHPDGVIASGPRIHEPLKALVTQS